MDMQAIVAPMTVVQCASTSLKDMPEKFVLESRAYGAQLIHLRNSRVEGRPTRTCRITYG